MVQIKLFKLPALAELHLPQLTVHDSGSSSHGGRTPRMVSSQCRNTQNALEVPIAGSVRPEVLLEGTKVGTATHPRPVNGGVHPSERFGGRGFSGQSDGFRHAIDVGRMLEVVGVDERFGVCVAIAQVDRSATFRLVAGAQEEESLLAGVAIEGEEVSEGVLLHVGNVAEGLLVDGAHAEQDYAEMGVSWASDAGYGCAGEDARSVPEVIPHAAQVGDLVEGDTGARVD